MRDGEDAPWNQRLVVDISRGGAKIAWQNGPKAGTRLILTLPEIQAEGTVVWRNEYYVGTRFRAPLSEAEFAAVLAVGPKGAASRALAGAAKAPPETKAAPETGAA